MTRRGTPDISVVIPARNERLQLDCTLDSVEQGRRLDSHLIEVVVVDDCSDPPYGDDARQRDLEVRVIRLNKRRGVAYARNQGARFSRAPLLFMTDAHVRLQEGWDELVLEHAQEGVVLAATITDSESDFRGYGCRLIVPFMGTRWIRRKPKTGTAVQIPSAAGTVLTKNTFECIGGYDEGMRLYGAIEPEFGVRAWLSGARVTALPSLRVEHSFKRKAEIARFLRGLRPTLVHNSLRFGMLYLGDLAVLQMVRYYLNEYPRETPKGLRMLDLDATWLRRDQLRSELEHDFAWFIRRFRLLDQAGGAVLRA